MFICFRFLPTSPSIICVGWSIKKLPKNFTSRKNTNTLFVGPGWFRWNILDNFCNAIFPSTNQQTILGPGERLLSLKIPPTIPYTKWICMRKPTCEQGHHLVHIWQASLSLPVLSYSLSRSLKQDSEAYGGGYIGHYLALWTLKSF